MGTDDIWLKVQKIVDCNLLFSFSYVPRFSSCKLKCGTWEEALF